MNQTSTRQAILDLNGGHCTSCAIAIEHAGRRIKGVQDIFVDRASSTIQVDYDGDAGVLEDICNIVERIGYEATVRAETSPPE